MKPELIQFADTPSAEHPVKRVFDYNGYHVTFAKKGSKVMVNATQMAKKFGKQPAFWTRTKQYHDFLDSYCAMRNCIPSDVVKVTNGDNGGTWMHEDIALEFARWLNPSFAIWCNDRIKELLTVGITAMPQTIDSILADPDNAIRLLTDLKEEREQRRIAESKALLLEEVTKEQAPKVAFADALLSSPDSILVNELAKILCQNGYKTGEIRLYEQLRKEGYLCKCGRDYNLPKQEYLEMGLFEVVKGTRSGNGGIQHQTRTTKVMPKGVEYFINKFVRHEPTLFT